MPPKVSTKFNLTASFEVRMMTVVRFICADSSGSVSRPTHKQAQRVIEVQVGTWEIEIYFVHTQNLLTNAQTKENSCHFLLKICDIICLFIYGGNVYLLKDLVLIIIISIMLSIESSSRSLVEKCSANRQIFL